jgi:hypothetical protein
MAARRKDMSGNKIARTFCLCLFAGIMAGLANAETYTWTDESGTVHFTEDYSSVPKHYRKKVGKRGDMGPSAPSQKLPAENKSDRIDKAADTVGTKADKNLAGETAEGLYGGKPLDVWKREFADREAQLRGMDQRIKEIETTIKQPGYIPTEKIKILSQEHQEAVQKYNDALSQYNQLMDTAKKAGVQIEIRK